MPNGQTVSGLHEFMRSPLYATVELKNTGDGFVSEWWISRNEPGSYELQVLGYLRLPVFGETEEAATRRIGFIYGNIFELLEAVIGGVADTGAGGDVVSARRHCKAHLQWWSDVITPGSRTEHTASLYSLAVEFGVNNPAALIAEVQVLPSVRTVHDRIAYARRIGILDSHGKGRIKVSVESESESESEDVGLFHYPAELSSPERSKEIMDRILRHSGGM